MRHAGDRGREASALFSSANLHGFALGEPDRADRLYDEATEIWRSLGDPLRDARMHNNRGWVKLLLGRTDEAGRHLEAALPISRERGDRVDECVHLVNLGLLRGLLGDTTEGRRLLGESRALCREIANRRVESYAVHRLGLLAEQEGSSAEAESSLREALAMRRGMLYAKGVAESGTALGRVLCGAGRPDEAAACLAEADSVGLQMGHAGIPVVNAVLRARLVPAGIPAAAALFAANESRLDHFQKMEARHVLWTLTQDRAHLAQAKRLLDHLVAHAPPEFQGTMVGRVPLYRDIAAAWAEHGGG